MAAVAWGADEAPQSTPPAAAPLVLGIAGGLAPELDSYEATRIEIRSLLEAAERVGWTRQNIVAGQAPNLMDVWAPLLRRRAEPSPCPLWLIYVGPITVLRTADGAEILWHVGNTTVSLADQILPLASVDGAPTVISILPYPRWLGDVPTRGSGQPLRLAGWPDLVEPHRAIVWWASAAGEAPQLSRGRLIAGGELARSLFAPDTPRPAELDWWTNRFGAAERRIRLETGGGQTPWRLVYAQSAGSPESTRFTTSNSLDSLSRAVAGIAVDAFMQNSEARLTDALDAAVKARDVGLVSFLAATLRSSATTAELHHRAAVWLAVLRLRYHRPAAAETAAREALSDPSLASAAQALRAAALWRLGQLNTARLLAHEALPRLTSATSFLERIAQVYAQIALGGADAVAGDLASAAETLRQAWQGQRELFEWFNPEDRAAVAIELARLARSQGRAAEAEEWCENALSELRSRNLVRAQAPVEFELGNARWAAGRSREEVLATWRSAAELWETHRTEPAPETLWIQIAEMAAELGDATLSAATLQQLESRRESLQPDTRPRMYRVRARLAYRAGDPVEALRWLQRALDETHALRVESPELVGELLSETAWVYAELNDDERAADFANRALEAWNRSSQKTDASVQLPTAQILARARTRQRRYADAAIAWSNVATLAMAPGVGQFDLWRLARREEARAWLAIGRAEQALDAVRDLTDPKLSDAEAADIALLRARAFQSMSRLEDAIASYEEARRRARQAGDAARSIEAEATARLALAWTAAGKFFHAQRTFGDAASLRDFVPRELRTAWASAEANVQAALRPHGPVGMYHDLATTADLEEDYRSRVESVGAVPK